MFVWEISSDVSDVNDVSNINLILFDLYILFNLIFNLICFIALILIYDKMFNDVVFQNIRDVKNAFLFDK